MPIPSEFRSKRTATRMPPPGRPPAGPTPPFREQCRIAGTLTLRRAPLRQAKTIEGDGI